MARFNRIPQSNHKRGGILEQRRRPAVKFQSHFALSQVVAMRLKHHLEAPLFDVCSAAENPSTSLWKGSASRFLPIPTEESGFNIVIETATLFVLSYRG